jgi:hypothetical protein
MAFEVIDKNAYHRYSLTIRNPAMTKRSVAASRDLALGWPTA